MPVLSQAWSVGALRVEQFWGRNSRLLWCLLSRKSCSSFSSHILVQYSLVILEDPWIACIRLFTSHNTGHESDVLYVVLTLCGECELGRHGYFHLDFWRCLRKLQKNTIGIGPLQTATIRSPFRSSECDANFWDLQVPNSNLWELLCVKKPARPYGDDLQRHKMSSSGPSTSKKQYMGL